MISRTAKTTWGLALAASLGAAAFWIYSSDPVRQAEFDLLRQSAEETKQLAASNRALTAALPSEDMDALRSVNSDLLSVRNQALQLSREIATLEKATNHVRVEETPEIKELTAKNQQLTAARAQQAAAIAQRTALAEAQTRFDAAAANNSPAMQLIKRLRGPDGSLSTKAGQAAASAIQNYRDANNGANAPTIDDLLPYIPAELLRPGSPDQFEVISVGPGGQETRTPGDAIRARRNR